MFCCFVGLSLFLSLFVPLCLCAFVGFLVFLFVVWRSAFFLLWANVNSIEEMTEKCGFCSSTPGKCGFCWNTVVMHSEKVNSVARQVVHCHSLTISQNSQ